MSQRFGGQSLTSIASQRDDSRIQKDDLYKGKAILLRPGVKGECLVGRREAGGKQIAADPLMEPTGQIAPAT